MEEQTTTQSNAAEFSVTSENIPSESLQETYHDAMLRSGIQAANLLTELIELKLMPDPRAKEMAEVAIEVLKLVNNSPMGSPSMVAPSE